MIIIKSEKELLKYLNKETNTLVFEDDVKFEISIDVKHNISAWNISADDILAGDISAWDISADDISAGDISARDISARDISARDISAWNILARDISYYAVCYAYYNINCKTIKGRRENQKHFCLDRKITITGEKK